MEDLSDVEFAAAFFADIPPILLAESIAYSFLLLAVFICAVELKARHLYHCTYRLFTLSVLLQWFGILLLSVTWTKYAVSGIGPFPNFGGIFTSASEISFLLLLLLMAKGRSTRCPPHYKIPYYTSVHGLFYRLYHHPGTAENVLHRQDHHLHQPVRGRVRVTVHLSSGSVRSR